MKKFKKETYFTLTGDELNTLVSKELAPLVKNPARFENFECVAEFEWNNYARYESSVNESDFMSDFYKIYDRQDIFNADKSKTFGLHEILLFMLENNIIKAGNYLIDPSW